MNPVGAAAASRSASFIPSSINTPSAATSVRSAVATSSTFPIAAVTPGPDGIDTYDCASASDSFASSSAPCAPRFAKASRSTRSRCIICCASGFLPTPCAATSGNRSSPPPRGVATAPLACTTRVMQNFSTPAGASGRPAKAATAAASYEAAPDETARSVRSEAEKSRSCAESHRRCVVTSTSNGFAFTITSGRKGGRALGQRTSWRLAMKKSRIPAKSDLSISEFLSSFFVTLNFRVSVNRGAADARCGL